MGRKKTGLLLLKGLGELILELVLAFIFLLIGSVILDPFGENIDSLNIDPELLILLGSVVFLAIFGIVWGLTRLIKKIIRNR